MQGDFSRDTFRPERGYSAVRLQQGRVSVDADWNEEGDIRAYLERTALSDVIGPSGTPEPGGFEISVSGGGEPQVGPGRYYVKGILCENAAAQTLTGQPFLPDLPLPTTPGIYLAYLDVWEWLRTYLHDPPLRELALDGPDTAAREQVVWQVRLEQVGDPGDSVACADFGDDWAPAGSASSGRLRARAETPPDDPNECLVPPGAGYRRQENQFYRVEIHDPGAPGTATFKWSRENGSVLTRLIDIDGNVLVIDPPGRDENLGWAPGNWVELSDDGRVLRGEPGVLVQLGPVAGDRLTVANWGPGGALTMADFGDLPTARRWDSAGALPLTAAGAYLPLEDGVEVEFDPDPTHAAYLSGDYWTFPARTATGAVAWPLDAADDPIFVARHGTAHAFARLALLTWDGATWVVTFDCRDIFPPLTGLVTLLHAGGDGQESLPGEPLARSLRVATYRGRFPVSGVRILFTAEGAGLAAATLADLATADATQEVITGPDGRAECFWQLENNLSTPVQSLEARLLDSAGNPQDAAIFFVGSLSLASGVFYEVDPACGNLSGQETVQSAVTLLSQIASLNPLSGDGQSLGPGESAAPLQAIAGTSCGPLAGATVRFTVAAGSGTLDGGGGPVDVTTDAQGVASVDWQPDATTPFQAVDAELTGGFTAAAPPTVARFTATRRLGGGSDVVETCCSNSVGKGGRFQTLKEALDALFQPELPPDVAICLLPGDHPVEEPLILKNPDGQPWTIEITGCGRGSRLICEGGIFLLGEDLASFALRHLDMQFKGTDESPLQMLGVREFTLEDCQITQESFSRALVWVAAAERIRFSDSTLRQGFPDDDEIATALAISDPRADTTWDNCRFIGHVLLYAEEFTPAGENEIHQIAKIANANELQLGEPQNNLRASGCHFTRMLVDAAFSAQIFAGNAPEPYRSIHLADCLFALNRSQVLASHITLAAARFQEEGTELTLMWGISHRAIYSSNASFNLGLPLIVGVPGGIGGSEIQHGINLLTLSDP